MMSRVFVIRIQVYTGCSVRPVRELDGSLNLHTGMIDGVASARMRSVPSIIPHNKCQSVHLFPSDKLLENGIESSSGTAYHFSVVLKLVQPGCFAASSQGVSNQISNGAEKPNPRLSKTSMRDAENKYMIKTKPYRKKENKSMNIRARHEKTNR